MSNPLTIVCMGSYGDLCIILPFAYDQFKKTGAKANIVVAQNYAALLDGVSYVNRIVYPETWKRGKEASEVQRAAEWITSRTGGQALAWINPVRSHGTRKQLGESFVHEMWITLGQPDAWRLLPLVFDKRDQERERLLVEQYAPDDPQKRFILHALNGVASPFPQQEELISALKEAFPDAMGVDLSQLRVDHPYDLLGLMDRAHLLIAADTFALHLSAASKVPVIALSRDMPSHWNGTPWHRRYDLHVRYSQYEMRKSEILHTAKRILAGIKRPGHHPMSGLEANGYNPSIVRWHGRLYVSYRHHPQRTWQTQLQIAQISEGAATAVGHHQVRFPEPLQRFSAEDMRLWLNGDRLFGSYSIATITPERKLSCVQRYSEIILSDGTAEMIGNWQPNYGRNDCTSIEKNWVFFAWEGRTFFIYACHPEHLVAEVKEETVIKEWRTPALTWNWGHIRGGTAALPYRGKWLRFFHSQVPISHRPRDVRYYVGACLMNNQPPFEMLAVSTHPILSGHEWRSGAAHWKANVVIPYGAVERQGGGWVVATGINDSAACLVRILEEHLNL